MLWRQPHCNGWRVRKNCPWESPGLKQRVRSVWNRPNLQCQGIIEVEEPAQWQYSNIWWDWWGGHNLPTNFRYFRGSSAKGRFVSVTRPSWHRWSSWNRLLKKVSAEGKMCTGLQRKGMIPKGSNVKQMSSSLTHRTDSAVTRADRRLFQLADECT